MGEAHVDPLRHVVLNPLHNYDEDVEFVSDIGKVKAGNYFIFRSTRNI